MEAANHAVRFDPLIRRWYECKRARKHRVAAIKQKRSSSGAGSRTKPLWNLRENRSKSPSPLPLSRKWERGEHMRLSASGQEA